jgi:NAD(P)H dehydrogenase (quinone)
MRVFIVHAHHEPSSFNGALTHTALSALAEEGHEAKLSDLYRMPFDPVSDRRNFRTVADPDRLRQQTEESYASAHDGFVPELQAEMDKLAWCDLLIFQFPLWWLGMPAIMKGWVDRVFAAGRAYGGGRWFESGVFAGKRAMCSVTVGGSAERYSKDGLYPPIEEILMPIHLGIFGFVGFTVIDPFVVYAPNHIDDKARSEYLQLYRRTLSELVTTDGAVDKV